MNGVSIESDYAGGNIRVVEERDGAVRVAQQLRDTSGWWFYWSFAATSSEARTIRFEFVDGEVVGPWGPAYSKDGIDWAWLGHLRDPGAAGGSRVSFAYAFEAGEKAYFCFAIPYQLHHFERYYARIASHPLVDRKVLAVTERLRAAPLLVLGRAPAAKHIVLTCRHHACEAATGYVLEGMLDYVLHEAQARLLESYRIHYAPFVDLDGAERGDQGKGRTPRDHNRDYAGRPLYRSTAAMMEYAGAFPLEVGIDFHCPYLWGGRNDRPFIVKRGSPMKEEIERFGALLRIATNRQAADGSRLEYDARHDIEMGEDWNVPNAGTCSSFFERRGARLAFSFEIPYFGTEDGVVTPDGCRRFGEAFGAALEAYLLERGMTSGEA